MVYIFVDDKENGYCNLTDEVNELMEAGLTEEESVEYVLGVMGADRCGVFDAEDIEEIVEWILGG